MPENMFYNTGIGTFIWILSNKKEERRKGKIQLIDATAMKSPLRKNMGKKNCEFTPEIRKEIVRLFLEMEESDVSMILTMMSLLIGQSQLRGHFDCVYILKERFRLIHLKRLMNSRRSKRQLHLFRQALRLMTGQPLPLRQN